MANISEYKESLELMNTDNLLIPPVLKTSNLPTFDIVIKATDVDQLFILSGNDLMMEYSDAHQERDHNISMAFTNENHGGFIAGISANCGKDNNSRGTGFTIDFGCIHITEAYQGKGLLDELLSHTIDNIMLHYPLDDIPNETCIEFTMVSEKGGYAAWKLYNLLKAKLTLKKTKVMLWEDNSSNYICSTESLENMIHESQFC